jgi:hypothetical protein
MLIPNADFYNHRATIVDLVEGRLSNPDNNVYAIYPEREYKEQHAAKSQNRITVHGHDVQQAYRDAAHLTNKILAAPHAALDSMKEAKTDP